MKTYDIIDLVFMSAAAVIVTLTFQALQRPPPTAAALYECRAALEESIVTTQACLDDARDTRMARAAQDAGAWRGGATPTPGRAGGKRPW